MKPWDLASGAARLRSAMKDLEHAVALAGENWNDDTFRAFDQRFLQTLRPAMRTALDALNRLEQVLDRALAECSSYQRDGL